MSSTGSRASSDPLSKTVTSGSILFDKKHTSRPAPAPVPHFRVYPQLEVPKRLSAMDAKRHPSSFQQLEKLGEGTYATVSREQTLRSTVSSPGSR
jgi:hypothetical protein